MSTHRHLAGASLAFAVGCQGSADGYWFGYLDCGPGSVSIDMELELRQTAGDLYQSSGAVSWTDTEDTWWEISYEGQVLVLGSGTGSHPLDVSFYQCTEVDLGTMDCPAQVAASWDRRQGKISGTIFDFLGELTCDFDLY